MDFPDEPAHPRQRHTMLYRVVYVVLPLLLGLQAYYFVDSLNALQNQMTDMKYMGIHLSRGLTEMNRKHEALQSAMEAMEKALPAVAAEAGRAEDALGPSRGSVRHPLDEHDHDRQEQILAEKSRAEKTRRVALSPL